MKRFGPIAVYFAAFDLLVSADVVGRYAWPLADLACAVTHGRTHPVFGLWPVALREALRRAMVEEEIRKVDAWTARYKLVEVAFPHVETPAGPLDPFFNTNRPEDLEEAGRYL